jgi:prepilin-type processing-associated H-X9-DG protein
MGMALYTGENDDRLPFAYIRYSEWESIAWDGLIYPFVLKGCEISSSSLDKRNDLLRCPVDTMGDRNRTYAMPQHDMSSTNWPPGPENRTGVGLWWSCWAGGNASLTNVVPAVGRIPAVRLEMIHAPADTLLLTEHANSVNSMFAHDGATISGPNDHLDAKTRKMNRYHNGKFNYLMVDGHVELLLPAQKQGIWTIQPND